jgi:heat-inducible transcriptional repressor
MTVDERRLLILAAVVERFIETGEPVGSKYVAELMNHSVSSATIRNDMAALEEEGLLDHMHTSSGRVPTHHGYRVYVSRMMKPVPLSAQNRAQIDALFNVRNADPDRVLEDAAQSLSELTGMAAVSAMILSGTVTVRRIDIIPAGPRTVVILVIASSGVVRSKVCRVDFDVTDAIVDFFLKFANSRLVGRSLDDITTTYLNAVSVSLGEYARLFLPVFTALYDLVREINSGQYVTRGTTNLLDYTELARTTNELLHFLEEKEAVIHLLEHESAPTAVYIGRESAAAQLTESSVLLSRYRIGDSATGVIAVIGPVRMDYARLLPKVEYFGKTLGRLLSDTYTEQ